MHKLTVFIFGLFMIFSNVGKAQNTISNSLEKEISGLLQKQVNAWNEGNLDKFMETYWRSDELVFIGANGPTYGYNKTLENYKRRYPDKDAMGKTSFDILKMSKIDNNTVFVIGRFELTRDMGDLAGHFTLVIQIIDGKWLIISDHTSSES